MFPVTYLPSIQKIQVEPTPNFPCPAIRPIALPNTLALRLHLLKLLWLGPYPWLHHISAHLPPLEQRRHQRIYLRQRPV